MRRVVKALMGVGSIAMTVGCGSNSEPLSTPVTSIDELRGLFTRAASSERTWTVAQTDTFLSSDPITCKVQASPVKASDCRQRVNATVGDSHTITFPDAQFLEVTHQLGGGDGMWYRYGADIPELANSFRYSWADLDTAFYFLPGVATIASTHSDQIDGKDVTRYDLDINTQAPRALPAGASKDTTETVQVWIGAKDLPVRAVIRTNSASTGESVTTTTYRDWGQSLDIQPPPADKTQPGPH